MIYHILISFAISLLLISCAKKPTKEKIPTSKVNLGIGSSPKLPSSVPNGNVSLIAGIDVKQNLVDKLLSETTMQPQNTPNNKPLLGSSAERRNMEVSDPITLMSGGHIVLTVWATKVGNWLWGYPPFNSIDLGFARQWRIITHQDGKVSFQNFLTGTCMSAYKNGVIHMPCSSDNPYQLWNLNPFSNRTVRIQNEATKTCLQTPVIRKKNFGSIFLAKCVTKASPSSGNNNISQQWIITAPLQSTPPLFVIN